MKITYVFEITPLLFVCDWYQRIDLVSIDNIRDMGQSGRSYPIILQYLYLSILYTDNSWSNGSIDHQWSGLLREIHDKSSELMGKTNMHPQELVRKLFFLCFRIFKILYTGFGTLIWKVDWISDKRGTLCCIYMKFSHEKSSPSWHPYRYQVAVSKGRH